MIVATERTEAGGAGGAQHNPGTVRKEVGTEMKLQTRVGWK
jgi:hypothetical protein